MVDRTPQPTPHWNFPRSPAATRGLVETGVSRGLTTAQCLAGTGLTDADLARVDGTIEAEQELRVGRNLLAALGDIAGLGVDAGVRYTLGNAGALGFALLTSSSPRELVRVGARYLALSSAFIRLSVIEDEALARIVFDDAAIPADVRDFFVERDLAAIAKILPLLINPDWFQFARVQSRLNAERCAALTALAPVVTFVPGQPDHALVVPTPLLDGPLPQADPLAAAMAVQQCELLLDKRVRRRGASAEVRALLLRSPAEMPAMDAIAEALHLDQRTLHRRLRREGTSFRALVNEIRETLAIDLLANSGLTVDQVSARLGYSEVAAFSRAFKAWTGSPPSQFLTRAPDSVSAAPARRR